MARGRALPLTYTPSLIKLHNLVNQRLVSIAPSLRFLNELWLASFLCMVTVKRSAAASTRG